MDRNQLNNQFFKDEINKKCNEYMNTPEFKRDLKKLKKSIHKDKFKKLIQLLKTNFIALISLAISITALIFTILTYLSALHQ